MAKHTNGKVERTDDSNTGEGPERRLSWTFPREGADWVGNARLIARGGRLYTASVTFSREKPVPKEEVDRFLNAFSLHPPEEK